MEERESGSEGGGEWQWRRRRVAVEEEESCSEGGGGGGGEKEERRKRVAVEEGGTAAQCMCLTPIVGGCESACGERVSLCAIDAHVALLACLRHVQKGL